MSRRECWPDATTGCSRSACSDAFARERLDIECEEIDGGHMVALSNPAALADRLEAYRLELQGQARDAGQ
jgi:hypothetical protein